MPVPVNRTGQNRLSSRCGGYSAPMMETKRGGPSVQVAFGPIVVEYDDAVIAPRPWTLAQSTWAAALSEITPPGPLLELYCGAGHIGLAAASLCGRVLVQVDDDPNACVWARRNAERAAIASDVRCAAVDAALDDDERFPLVIADPPYLTTDDVERYPNDPVHAVDGGPDGLAEIGRCLRVVSGTLAPDGAVLLQVRGPGQRDEIAALLAATDSSLRLVEAMDLTAERSILLLRCS